MLTTRSMLLIAECSIIFLLTSTSGQDEKLFAVESQIEQIINILYMLPDRQMPNLDFSVVPKAWSRFIPFSVRLICEQGTATVRNVKRGNDKVFMKAVSKNESHISGWFSIGETEFNYDDCKLHVLYPIPLKVKGRITQSNFYVSSRIFYEPKCKVVLDKKVLVSFDSMTVNFFDWLPGIVEQSLTALFADRMKVEVFASASQAIEMTVSQMTDLFNACVAFPAEGSLPKINQGKAPRGEINDAEAKSEGNRESPEQNEELEKEESKK